MNKIDILNRGEIVNQLIRLIENISDNKTTTCFALNGSWGCGKSFVLDMLEEKLEALQSEEICRNKYFIIRYNSWKYDYYEEPLMAIVSTMISEIEEKTKVFLSQEQKAEVVGILKNIAKLLCETADSIVKNKIGISPVQAVNIVREGKENGDKDYEAEHQYDKYADFNKGLRKLKQLLQQLSQDFTIILFVDELDRCIPEYTIKVLERLHHLTENTSNIITIVATDKSRLSTGIKQIFGFEDPDKYLEKFMSFSVSLDCGTISKRIIDKYCDYIDLFDKNIFPFHESIEECLSALFKNIDMRTQEYIMKKVILAHKLLFTEKKDYSFMCTEVLIAVMMCVYTKKPNPLDESVFLNPTVDIFQQDNDMPMPAFSQFFKERFDIMRSRQKSIPDDIDDVIRYELPEKVNLYGVLIYFWYWIHKPDTQTVIYVQPHGVYEPICNNYHELKKFAETFQLLK